MNADDILIGAAKIIEEEGWCRGTMARDKNDEPVEVMSDDACQFCLLGALFKTVMTLGAFNYNADPGNTWLYREAKDKFIRVMGVHPMEYNDRIVKDKYDVSYALRYVATHDA